MVTIAAKAATTAWYCHRRDALAARGELPSQIVQLVNVKIAKLGDKSAEELRAGMQMPTEPASTGHAWPMNFVSSNGATTERVSFGNFDRDGWTVSVPFGSDHRMHGWASQADDGRRIGRASACAALLSRATDTVGQLLGPTTLAAVVVTAAMWRRRRSLGQYALAASLLCCAARSLSAFPDRTFLQPGREAIHWTAVVVTVIAAGITFWPTRRAKNPSLCQTCDYNLTGNLSGVCPECGTSVAGSVAVR